MAETVGALILSAVGATEIAGIAGLGTIATTTIAGVSLATVVGTAAIIGVSIGLQYALNNPKTPRPEDGSQPVRQGIAPRVMGYGRNRLAGNYMLFEAFSPPSTSCDVLAFHSGRVASIVSMYLHDDPVVLNADLNTGVPTTVSGTWSDGRYDGVIQVEARKGLVGESALSAMVSNPDSGWTAQHVGNGIAHLGMICTAPSTVPNFTKRFPRQLPLPSLVVDCAPVWDPRDEAQSREDEDSWQISYNPVLQLIDYLTRSDGGMGLDYETVIAPKLAELMVEADLCDELVEKADASFEPRYQSSGWFQFDNAPENIIGEILSTCDGWLAESGEGALTLTVGVYREPEDPPLTERHIFGFSLNYGGTDEDLINQLDISFTDPASKYVSVQPDPWRDEESISLVGRVKAKPLDLKWVQSHSQARRLADRAMQRLNASMDGSFTTTLYGLRYLGKRWIPIQYPFVSGLQDCVVEIQDAEVDLLAGRISWQFIRIAPDAIEAYEPDTDEGEVPTVPPPLEGSAYAREAGTHLIREDDSIYSRETV